MNRFEEWPPLTQGCAMGRWDDLTHRCGPVVTIVLDLPGDVGLEMCASHALMYWAEATPWH